LGDFPVDETSHFILIASTLVLIKSKSLLPTLDLTVEEEQNIEDLENQLKLHQKFKELANNLRKKFGKNIIFTKKPSFLNTTYFAPDKNTNLSNLRVLINKVIENMPKPDILPKTLVKKVISLEEAIFGLTERITSNLKMSFREFSGIGKAEKVSVIVNFLAMLELVKQGIIRVKQENLSDDIEMETNNLAVPKY
jgi:segregation and condensation protein A